MSALAVIVGLDLNGLGVLRSLARVGVPALVLDPDLTQPAATTRFGHKRRIAGTAGTELIEALLRLRATLPEDPVLLLTQEASVATVSAERSRLAGFRFSMPDDDLMQALLDKLRFQALAENLGFPIPRAIRLTSGEAADAVATLRFPCVLKPTTKDPEYARHFKKAYKVAGPAEVASLWQPMCAVVDEVIVQEWIEGDDSDVYFCLQYRQVGAATGTSFVGRKIRQWPPLVGGTACCLPAPEAAAELTDLTDRFFAAVGFCGVGSMEYKRDRRDGRFYMVEPTVGRTDFQQEIATLNGVNLPWAAYLGETGGAALPAARSLPAIGWRDPIGDANAREAGAPADPPGARFSDAYFRWDDPGPFAALKSRAVINRLRRLLPGTR